MPKLYYTNYTNVSHYRSGPPTCWYRTLSEKQVLNEFSNLCQCHQLIVVYSWNLGPFSTGLVPDHAILLLEWLGACCILELCNKSISVHAQQTQNQKPNCAVCDWLCSWHLCCETHYQAFSYLHPLDTRGMCLALNQRTTSQEVRQLSAMKTNKIEFWCFFLPCLTWRWSYFTWTGQKILSINCG